MPNTPPATPLMTEAEVAAYLHVPAETVRYWRHQGTGPQAFRVGRHVRYRPADVERWLEDQAVGQ